MGIPTSSQPLWLSFFLQIALLYSQVLLLMLIPGILVFHYAWNNHHRLYGLYVLTYFPESWFFKHIACSQAWRVQVESSGEWYLDSKQIEPDALSEALRIQIGERKNCIVFFDAKPDVPYAEAIQAIDLIKQSPGRVVLRHEPGGSRRPQHKAR